METTLPLKGPSPGEPRHGVMRSLSEIEEVRDELYEALAGHKDTMKPDMQIQVAAMYTALHWVLGHDDAQTWLEILREKLKPEAN